MDDPRLRRQSWVEPREFASRPKGEGFFAARGVCRPPQAKETVRKGVVDLNDKDDTADTRLRWIGDGQFCSPLPTGNQRR
jgi:hypothetical protein